MKKSSTRIAALARRFRRAEEGAVSILVAGMLVVLLGMTGLAVEVGLALFKRQQQQTVADAAAYSGAVALAKPESLAAVTEEARATAANAGYVNGANSIVVTVNSPPVISVAQAGKASAVEVVIQQPLTMTLANLVNSWYGASPINWTVQASSVAIASSNPNCVLQLGTGGSRSITINNGATVALKGCGMTACSTVNNALTIAGAALNITDTSGNLTTQYPVSVGGTASISNGGKINGDGTCSSPLCKASQGACASNIDSYAGNGETMPPISGNCQFVTNFCSGFLCTSVMPKGRYCYGANVLYGNVTMVPGTYFIAGGAFSVAGGATLTCPTCTGGLGVTIVLTSNVGVYAYVNIAGGATVTLNAPTSGPTAGIVFFGDPSAPVTNNNTFQGGSTLNITGAYYFPSQELTFSNGAFINSSTCTQIIGADLNFQGGMTLESTCQNAGTQTIGSGGGTTALVE